jgi:hypothetical protein
MDYTILKAVNDLVLEAKAKEVPSVAKTTAKAVYHRDYVKTKDKKYRKDQKSRQAKKAD